MTTDTYDAELRHWQLAPYWGGDLALGYIYNDAKGRFDDGTFVRTSKVVSVDGNILTTRNTRYLLVEPADKTATVHLPKEPSE